MADWAPKTIAIIGASGGIGAAILRETLSRYSQARVHAFSRSGSGEKQDRLVWGRLNYDEPESIEAAANSIDQPLDLVIVATGLLKNDRVSPEKSLRDLDAEQLARLFHVNTIGPALVAKHFLPKMKRDERSVFAALSARVGSISDNRLGGWYGYRAAKSALNQMLKTASIEQARKFKQCAVIGLHPGTVDTALSKPFQANVADGKLFSPEQSANYLLKVIEQVSPKDSGKVFDWQGAEVPS